MLRRNFILDDDSRHSDTSEDETLDKNSRDSDDRRVIIHRRKRLRIESESSESSSSSAQTEELTCTDIPPTKSFSKATNT